MQTAGLIGTFGAILAGCAQVTFLDQPDLRERELSVIYSSVDDLFKNRFQRPFLGHLEEQLHSHIWIKASVTGRIHSGSIFALLECGKSTSYGFSKIQIFELRRHDARSTQRAELQRYS